MTEQKRADSGERERARASSRPTFASARRPGAVGPATVTHVTRLKLLVMLPLTMTLLVAATGFFTLKMASRIYLLHGLTGPALSTALSQLTVQVGLISAIAGLLGLGMSLGVTAPLRQLAARLEAIAAGDLRGAVDVRSTSEVDSLAGAFNEAVRAINSYIFQSMTGAVVTLSPDGIVTASSPATEAVLGYHEEEVVGKRFSEVFAPAGGARDALAAIERAIANRQIVAVDDVEIAAKDGRTVRIGVNLSYLRPAGDRGDGADTEAVGVMIAFKDLTEIRRLRDRLQQADQLVALGTLTAGVAHELRNPLASLQGLVELLGRDFGEQDPRRRYISTMLDAIGRLNRLVEDLLLLSSPGAPSQEAFDLVRSVRETVSFTDLGLGEKRVTLTTDGEKTPAIVMGSPLRLGQAITNIVMNAIQATPDGGAVTVATTADATEAIVRIHNTGSYIKPEQMKQLFVPFYTTKSTGTGLGLAIARQIVTAHGGRIEVESAQDSGTMFTIALPLAGDAHAAA